jgi:hypothetical protein
MKTIDKNNSTTDTRNGNRNPAYNKNTDKYRDPDSKTFNEDEESWKNKNSGQQEGTPGNDWDANNPVERGTDYRYDDEQRDASDYINADHSDYNRGNSRYGWYDAEENF